MKLLSREQGRTNRRRRLVGFLSGALLMLIPVGANAGEPGGGAYGTHACPQPPPGSAWVIDFGATPNGGGDDTVAFQDAFNASDDVWVPSGAYEISSPLQLNDNQHLAMHCEAVLEAAVQIWRGDEHGWPGDAGARAVLEVLGKTDVTIEGGTVDGQEPTNPDARAFGLFIRGGASNILIKDSTFRRFPGVGGGDGVFIGPERTQTSGSMPVNVTLENVRSLSNFRQG